VTEKTSEYLPNQFSRGNQPGTIAEKAGNACHQADGNCLNIGQIAAGTGLAGLLQ
jgi:hypothetical protein